MVGNRKIDFDDANLLAKIFYEISEGLFSNFSAIYFLNLLGYSKLEVFFVLSLVPFFSRFLRPFLYFYLRPRYNLYVINLFSIFLMIVGFSICAYFMKYYMVLFGIAILSIGQGLYKISLRRQISKKFLYENKPSLQTFLNFVLSTALSPILFYPIGYFVINNYGNNGIFLASLISLFPLMAPHLFYNKKIYNDDKEAVFWRNILNVKFIPMFFWTFLIVFLSSSVFFSLPIFIYGDATKISIFPIILMSVSGCFGVIIQKKILKNIIITFRISLLIFMISPILLLFSYIKIDFYSYICELFSISFFMAAKSMIFPIMLSLPNNKNIGGDIESRYFIHSIAMALGAILNISISSFYFFNININSDSVVYTGIFLIYFAAFLAFLLSLNKKSIIYNF